MAASLEYEPNYSEVQCLADEPEDEPLTQQAAHARGAKLRVDLGGLRTDPAGMVEKSYSFYGMPFRLKIYPRGHGYSQDTVQLVLEGPPGVTASFELWLNNYRARFEEFKKQTFKPSTS